MALKHFFRPISPWSISQRFGENRACVDIATGTKFITCDGNNPPPGYKSVYKDGGHSGIDIPAKRWTRVYASYDGVVHGKETNEMRGLGIAIFHKIDGRFYITKYWHLAAMDVDVGEEVKMGDFIGYADNTGWSSGDHLHFEIGTCTQYGTDYTPVDPISLMHPVFALDARAIMGRIREQIAVITDKIADYLRGR